MDERLLFGSVGRPIIDCRCYVQRTLRRPCSRPPRLTASRPKLCPGPTAPCRSRQEFLRKGRRLVTLSQPCLIGRA
jgi:hypothetical protein